MRFRSMYEQFSKDHRFRACLEQTHAFRMSVIDDIGKQLDERRDRQRSAEDEIRSAIDGVAASALENTCRAADASSQAFDNDEVYQREEEERRRRAMASSSYYMPST